MLHSVEDREFYDLAKRKDRKDAGNFQIGMRVLRALTTHWIGVLPAQQITILLFLWNRTLNFSKQGQQVFQYQFHKGVVNKDTEQRICAGLNMSDPTLRKHLNELCDANLIDIYRCVSANHGNESVPRLYEINCRNVLKGAEDDQGIAMLPTPKRLKNAGKGGPKILKEGGKDSWTHKICIYNETAKAVIPPPASPRRSERSAASLPTPRKARGLDSSVCPSTDDLSPSPTAKDVIRSIDARYTRNAASRTASAAAKKPWQVTKEEMQATLDGLQREFAPSSQRMMVTVKELGLLKKRMKENPPADLRGFLQHVVMHWPTLARQHGAAVRKRVAFKAGESAMSAAHSFHDLAYRYPYFLKVYANHLAGKAEETSQAELDAEKKRLQATIEKQAEDIQTLRRRATATRPAAISRQPRSARPAPAVQPQRADVDPFGDIPTWEEHEALEKQNVG